MTVVEVFPYGHFCSLVNHYGNVIFASSHQQERACTMTTELFPTIVELAEHAERNLHNSDLGFEMGEAQLYSITFGMHDDEPSVNAQLEMAFPDVYDMIESDQASTVAKQAHYVAIVTTGWAAPLNNGEVEGAPSEHPMKRRVRLTVIANREEMASVIRFQDDDDVVVDEGSATGTLADAIYSLMHD